MAVVPPSIAIVGAGIGGLTLGRCLYQNRIPFRIYEVTTNVPRNHYGITLQPQTWTALLNASKSRTPEAFRRKVAVDGHLRDGGTGTPTLDTSDDIRANRRFLESFLPEGFSLRLVKYSHRLQKIETTEGGGVTLMFDAPDAAHVGKSQDLPNLYGEVDGFSAKEMIASRDGADSLTLHPQRPGSLEVVKADLVIDCGGIFSPVRRILLPEHVVSRETFERFYAPAFGSANVLDRVVELQGYKHPPRLEISINTYSAIKKEISMDFTYSRRAKNDYPFLKDPDLSHRTSQPYAKKFFAELEALENSVNLPPVYTQAFSSAQARAARGVWRARYINSIRVSDEDVKKMRSQGVVMMGDAAFAEPIIGGNGANHAMRQAMKLAGDIVREWKGDKPPSEWDLTSYLESRPDSSKEAADALLEKAHTVKAATGASSDE